MTPIELTDYDYPDLVELIQKGGGQRAFARRVGIPRTSLQDILKRAKKARFKNRPAPRAVEEKITRGIRRFILTAAQDSTTVHEGFLDNLERFRDHLAEEAPCELIVAGFTYNKSLFEDHGKKKPLWNARLQPYMRSERIRIGDKIDFCAEMNTLPTAETPLSGFETYTRHRWGIFPHAKVQLKSIPTMKHEPAKIIMTTGAVTLPNYVPKRAGIKASFHHMLGAVLVEIDAKGRFFCRHLLADKKGNFYDCDTFVSDQGITKGHRVEAISWGDIHVAQLDTKVALKGFGIEADEKLPRMILRAGSGDLTAPPMLDALKPSYQFFHDVADFRSRNHHDLGDHHAMFDLHCRDGANVEAELMEVAYFISYANREWCQTVIVESNHDLALKRWLKTPDHYAKDPLNALFFLRCQLATYEAIKSKDERFSIFESVLRRMWAESFKAEEYNGVLFLREDESFRLFDIEFGIHGHLGANGARGSLNTFRKMGPKANVGHAHSAAILDGIYQAGVSGNLDMGYNRGLSSWSHSHIVTYANGKRAIITMSDGEWRL
jgi:hypothetical protein